MIKHVYRHLATAGISFLIAAAAACPAFAADLSGHLDTADQNQITGWAWDKEEPSKPVTVELTLSGDSGPNGVITLSVTADQARDDLKKNLGYASHAFIYDIDWNQYEGNTFTITAVAVSGETRTPLDGSFTYRKGATTATAHDEKKKQPASNTNTGGADSSEGTASQKDASSVGPGFDGSSDSSAQSTNENGLEAGEQSGPTKDNTNTAPVETGEQGDYLGEFTATGYCNCSQCSGGYSRTYSGTIPRSKHTIAANLNVFPIGTKLMIDGIVYTVEDTGSGVYRDRLDIYFDTHQEALNFGMKKVKVYSVK